MRCFKLKCMVKSSPERQVTPTYCLRSGQSFLSWKSQKGGKQATGAPELLSAPAVIKKIKIKKKNRGKKGQREGNLWFECVSSQPLQANTLPFARGWLKDWKIMRPHQICLVGLSLLLTWICICSYSETNQMNSSVELQPNSQTTQKIPPCFITEHHFHHYWMQFSHCLITLGFISVFPYSFLEKNLFLMKPFLVSESLSAINHSCSPLLSAQGADSSTSGRVNSLLPHARTGQEVQDPIPLCSLGNGIKNQQSQQGLQTDSSLYFTPQTSPELCSLANSKMCMQGVLSPDSTVGAAKWEQDLGAFAELLLFTFCIRATCREKHVK